MIEPFATREFSCLSPTGERFAFTVQIGRPTPVSDKPDSDWRCPVTIPFDGPVREIYGVDSWQAVCLALSLVHSQLVDFVQGEGLGEASFRRDCVPLLRGQPDLERVLSSFDVFDLGRCTLAPSRHFPYVFAARVKGSSGEYGFLLVIDRASAIPNKDRLLVDIYTPAAESALLGIAVFPRDTTKKDFFSHFIHGPAK